MDGAITQENLTRALQSCLQRHQSDRSNGLPILSLSTDSIITRALWWL